MNTLTQDQLTKSIEVIVSFFRLQLPATTLVQVDMDETAISRELNAAFALGVAQEREECEKVCEVLALDPYTEQTAKDCVIKIRARSKA